MGPGCKCGSNVIQFHGPLDQNGFGAGGIHIGESNIHETGMLAILYQA